MINEIIGQNRAVKILDRAIITNKVAQAYLFHGQKGIGKFTTALKFAMALNCKNRNGINPCGICSSCKKISNLNHQNLIYVFPTPLLKLSEKGEIKNNKYLSEYKNYLEQKIKKPWKPFQFSATTEIHREKIINLQYKINLSTTEEEKKIVIIEDADQMNISASNTFLKTLEEPQENTIFILTTTKIDSLLPTILSRCQKIKFNFISTENIEKLLINNYGVEKIKAKLFAKISDGDIERCLELNDSGNLEFRSDSIKIIEFCISKDDLEFLKFLEKYKNSKNVENIIYILSNLIIWLSDVVYFSIYKPLIANIDQHKLFEHLLYISPQITDYIIDLIIKIEERIKNLRGHTNPQLVLIDTYFLIRKTIFYGK